MEEMGAQILGAPPGEGHPDGCRERQGRRTGLEEVAEGPWWLWPGAVQPAGGGRGGERVLVV